MTPEQNQALHDFDSKIRNQADDALKLMPDTPEFWMALGRVQESLERRHRFCHNQFKLEVW